MIAYLGGVLTHKEAAQIILNVSGVGYQARIPVSTWSQLPEPGARFLLYTHVHVVDGAQQLYGFASPDEKTLFLHLLSVTGVGPGTALTALSSLSPAELHGAIVAEDVRTIQSIKGLGAKTAQRIVLELRDKLRKESLAAGIAPAVATRGLAVRQEALAALVMLGIPKASAEKSLEAILKADGPEQPVEVLIKKALKAA